MSFNNKIAIIFNILGSNGFGNANAIIAKNVDCKIKLQEFILINDLQFISFEDEHYSKGIYEYRYKNHYPVYLTKHDQNFHISAYQNNKDILTNCDISKKINKTLLGILTSKLIKIDKNKITPFENYPFLKFFKSVNLKSEMRPFYNYNQRIYENNLKINFKHCISKTCDKYDICVDKSFQIVGQIGFMHDYQKSEIYKMYPVVDVVNKLNVNIYRKLNVVDDGLRLSINNRAIRLPSIMLEELKVSCYFCKKLKEDDGTIKDFNVDVMFEEFVRLFDRQGYTKNKKAFNLALMSAYNKKYYCTNLWHKLTGKKERSKIKLIKWLQFHLFSAGVLNIKIKKARSFIQKYSLQVDESFLKNHKADKPSDLKKKKVLIKKSLMKAAEIEPVGKDYKVEKYPDLSMIDTDDEPFALNRSYLEVDYKSTSQWIRDKYIKMSVLKANMTLEDIYNCWMNYSLSRKKKFNRFPMSYNLFLDFVYKRKSFPKRLFNLMLFVEEYRKNQDVCINKSSGSFLRKIGFKKVNIKTLTNSGAAHSETKMIRIEKINEKSESDIKEEVAKILRNQKRFLALKDQLKLVNEVNKKFLNDNNLPLIKCRSYSGVSSFFNLIDVRKNYYIDIKKTPNFNTSKIDRKRNFSLDNYEIDDNLIDLVNEIIRHDSLIENCT
jgi:hypothetical protein